MLSLSLDPSLSISISLTKGLYNFVSEHFQNVPQAVLFGRHEHLLVLHGSSEFHGFQKVLQECLMEVALVSMFWQRYTSAIQSLRGPSLYELELLLNAK